MNTVGTITELTEIEPAPNPDTPKPYCDPILLYGVGLLIVAVLSFYGGFTRGVDRKTTTETQATLAIGRACIDYVNGLRPRKVAAKPEAATWITDNCGRIAQRSIERINGMKAGEIRGKP